MRKATFPSVSMNLPLFGRADTARRGLSSGPSASTNTNGSPFFEIIRFSSSMLAHVTTHGTDDAGLPKFPSPIFKVCFSRSVRDDKREKPGAYWFDVRVPQYSIRSQSTTALSHFVIVLRVSVIQRKIDQRQCFGSRRAQLGFAASKPGAVRWRTNLNSTIGLSGRMM